MCVQSKINTVHFSMEFCHNRKHFTNIYIYNKDVIGLEQTLKNKSIY